MTRKGQAEDIVFWLAFFVFLFFKMWYEYAAFWVGYFEESDNVVHGLVPGELLGLGKLWREGHSPPMFACCNLRSRGVEHLKAWILEA